MGSNTNIALNFLVDNEAALVLLVAGGTTCAEIRQQWRDFAQEADTSFHFSVDAEDGSELPLEGAIEDLYPSRRVLVVHVARSEQKRVRVFGCQQPPVAIQPLPRESVHGLTQRAKALFGVEPGRAARLLCGGSVLRAEASASAEAAGCALLELDLECRFAICCLEAVAFQPPLRDAAGRLLVNGDLPEAVQRDGLDASDPWTLPAFAKPAEQHDVRLYASDPARAFAGGSDEWRATTWSSLFLSGDRVSATGDEPVCALLAEEALLYGVASGVVLERQMAVWVEEKLRQRSRSEVVWPLTKPGDLLVDANDSVLLEGEALEPQQTLWEAGLQEGCCLSISRLLPLCVFAAHRGVTKLTADLGESLVELRERLSLPEEEFEIWGDDNQLCDETRSLQALGLSAGSVVMALPRSRAVVLSAAGLAPVRLPSVPNSVTFRGFLQAASTALGTQLPPDTRFVCACGRTYSDESAERRDFPLRCCAALEPCFSIEPPSRSIATQTVLRIKEMESKEVTPASEISAQTDRVSPEIAKFFISWKYDRKADFRCTVPFVGNVSGQQLRKAIAEVREVRPAYLALQQVRGRRRRDGTVVVWLGYKVFADASGEKTKRKEVEAEKLVEIGDNDIVGLAGRQEAWITVFKR